MLFERRQRELAHVLDEERDLARDLRATDAEAARRVAIARVVTVGEGSWEPPAEAGEPPAHLGLLILTGLMTRDVVMSGIGCTELLGKGDLLHPWSMFEGEPSVPMEVKWAALEPTRLALLDDRFLAATARWPTIAARLVSRAVRRSHTLAIHLAITCLAGLELRLYVLFWHLADRFGYVERDGVVVPLQLTHETLARLVAARRPSVTTALKKLREQRLVVAREEDGSWLVRGDPLEEIERMQALWREQHSHLPVRGNPREL